MNRKIKELPPVELLQQLLAYDKESGDFLWKHRDLKHFNATEKRTKEQTQARWNSRFAGKVAGSATHSKGYRVISLFGKLWQAHRIAYLMASGVDPLDLQIDHINGNRVDNSFSNLRLATATDNNRNASMQTNNTSGTMGISPYRYKHGCWIGQVRVDGKVTVIKNPRTGKGYFEDFERPVLERMLEAKRRELGYHNNHGSKLKEVK